MRVKSKAGLVTGTVAALATAVWMTIACCQAQADGEAWCHKNFSKPADKDALEYCLAQNGQGPLWALGCGIWFVAGAFGLGYGAGKVTAGAVANVKGDPR